MFYKPLLYYCIAWLSCHLIDENLYAVRITTQLPINVEKDTIRYLKDSFDIYYGKEKTMYIFSGWILPDNPDSMIDISDTYNLYVVYKNGDSIGRYYPYGQLSTFSYVNIDSILKLKGFNKMEIFDSSAFTLINSNLDKRTETLHVSYLKNTVLGNTLPDSLECTFANIGNEIPFSFSPILENKYRMKNISNRLVFNSHPASVPRITTFPKTEILFSLKQIKPNDSLYKAFYY